MSTPSTEWKEVIPEGEAAHLEALAQQIHALQTKPLRALHAKAHLGVEAELTVLDDVPEYARVGLFAKPASYRAYVRYSNGAGRRQVDRKGDVRGVAIKIVGVDGKKIIPGLESARTQDFLLIRTPSTPFRDPDEFVWLVRAAQRPLTLLPRAIGRFGFRAFSILRKLVKGVSAPIASVATARYFSAVPIKFGPYAARYAMAPHAHDEAGARAGKSADYLGEELAARLATGPVTYDFRVQFFVDEEKTPIEDASREWSEADAPFVTVARLTLPKQDVRSPRGQRVAERIESMSFDPWHATEDFRPLGSMMRARNHAYRMSTMARGAAPEPDGSETFD